MCDQHPRGKMSNSPSGSRNRSSKRLLREANSPDSKTAHEEDSKPPLTPTLKVAEDVYALRNRRKSSIRFEGSPNRSSSFSRSRSLKAPRQHLSQPNIYEETKQKHASFSHSLSVPGDPRDFQRLRNFSVTSKGVINRGDSFRAKSKTKSASKLASENDEKDQSGVNSQQDLHGESQKAGPLCTANSSSSSSPLFRVWILGTAGVGKSSLKQQFMTSEYICQNDAWNDELNQKSVIIVVNGEEAELELVECAAFDDKARTEVSTSPDAYIIVYSVTNRRSFVQAKHLLSRAGTNFSAKATILVGNKTDLARLRTVPTVEGRTLAKEHGVKFIETSVAINHQVDELLVGTITQIRMKSKAAEKHKKNQESRGASDSPSRPQRTKSKAPGIIKRIWRKTCRVSKSCDNLHAL